MKYTFTRCIRVFLMIIVAVAAYQTAQAQYTLSTLETGGAYTAVTKDNSNNIYAIRRGSGSNARYYEVVKFTGGTATVIQNVLTDTSAAIQANYPRGIAVNSHGDVFVLTGVDVYKGLIYKLASGSYTQSVVHGGNYYSAITVDKDDNLLTLEYNSTTLKYDVVRYSYGAESAMGTRLYDGLPVPAAGTSYPLGLVTDSQGNIYFTDFLESAAHPGGAVMKLTYPGYGVSTLATGREFTALAMDANNNLYTIEAVRKGVAKVVRYADPAGTGVILDSSLTISGIAYPKGLAVTSDNIVFAGDGAANNKGRIIQITQPGVKSVSRNGAPSVNTSTVIFVVKFNTAEANVSAASFTLTTTGVSGGAISGVIKIDDSTYNVIVNTGTGDGTIRLDVNGTGITPALLNVPFTAGEVYTIDKTLPVISLAINGGATTTNNSNVSLTETATDAGTPLQMRFSTDSSNWSAYETFAAGKTYTLSAGDGNKKVYMQVMDAAGNVSGTSAAILLDQTGPTVSYSSVPPASTNSATGTFTFTANEIITGFTASIDGASYLPATSPFTITGLSEGVHSISVKATDVAGNEGTAATYTWRIDQTAPVVSFVSTPPALTNQQSGTFTFTASESVSGYTAQVDGGNYVPVSSPYTLTGLGEGAHSISVKATDVAGNEGTAATYTWTIDQTAPTVTSVEGPPSLTNSSSSTFTFTADESVAGYATSLDGGSFVPATSPYTITGLSEGTHTVSVKATDLAGNEGAPVIYTWTVDQTAPVVSFVTTPPAVTNQHSSTFTFTANDSIIGYAASVDGGRFDEVTSPYTITGLSEGSHSIIVRAKDLAGNTGNGTSYTWIIDQTAPVIQSATFSANGTYHIGQVLTLTLNMSEVVNTDNAGDAPYVNLTIGSTTVKAVYAAGAGTNAWTFTYTVQEGDLDNDGVAIQSPLLVNGNALTDVAGNVLSASFSAAATPGVKVNGIRPTVALTTSAAASVSAAFTVTATFSEAVTGLSMSDFNVGNGMISGLSTMDNITYTLTVTPAAEGNVTVNLPANVAVNIAGNSNTTSNTLSVLADLTAPVVTNVTVPANGYYKSGDVLNFSLTFGEMVTVTGTPHIAITIGSSTVYADYVSGTGTTTLNFSYTVADGDKDLNGIAVGALSSGNIKDAAGNAAVLTFTAPSTSGVLVNTISPVISQVTVPADGYYKSGSVLNFTTTFSDVVNVTGTPHFAITLGSSTVYADYVSGTGTSTLSFSYTVVNGDQDLDGIAVGALSGGSIKDVFGNAAVLSSIAPSTAGVLVNTIAPVITQVSVPANGYYHAGQVLNFSVKFNALVNVTGTPVLPVTIGSTGVNAAYVSGTGSNTLVFSYTVQDGDNDLDGLAISAITGTIQDAFGNEAVKTLNNAGSTAGVYVYTVHPTVTLSTAATLVNAAFNATATFSEAVTGLTAADFTITNGAASNLQTSDNITYTVTITPSADGNVIIALPADAAVNKGDNGNTASNTLTVISDITASVITNGQTFSINEYSAAGTTLGTVTAVEAMGTLQNWTITNDPSGAFAINAATGELSVKDETALNAAINTTVSLIITVGDGINVSNATIVAVAVVYVPLPPTDITLDNNSIVENTPVNTLVGHLSAVTAEPNPVYTYTLVTGIGSTDNASFTISGNQLLTSTVLDYDVKNIYTVRIRATLGNGLYTEKDFTIRLGQVNQAPTLDPVADQEVCDITTAQKIQTTGASAVEDGQTLSYTVRAEQPFFTSLEVNANGLITYHLKPNESGIVHVTVTVKDNGGTAYSGVDTLAVTFAIKVNALPTVVITADQDTVISKGTAMNLTATGGVSYEWSNASGIVDGQQTATLQIKPVENTVYNVTVTDNNGCVNEGAMTITVVNEFKIDAINLLTPNGDGKNDKWIINDLSRYPNNDLTIYDRSGRVVYHTKNYNNNWDATYNGSPLSEGTYYYILKADGYSTPAKGFITIIRDQH